MVKFFSLATSQEDRIFASYSTYHMLGIAAYRERLASWKSGSE
jgi:hypothetical protein